MNDICNSILCRSLSEKDKNILIEACKKKSVNILKTASIFYKEGVYSKKGIYNVFSTNPNSEIYYVYFQNGNHKINLFIDKNKKIIFDSKYFTCISINNDVCIKNLCKIIDYINEKININENIFNIGENYLSIESWADTYGHFKDEMFTLSDYQEKYDKNKKIFTEINNKLPYGGDNYKKIANILFKNNYLNPYEEKYNDISLLKLKNLTIIKHKYNYEQFHKFPINITKKILNSIEDNYIKNDKIFISRNHANHSHRHLDNMEEIEDYFSKNNIKIFNPEKSSYESLINNLRNCNTIIITWGSVLVNLIYLKPNTNVYILKSKSYEKETIHLFNKIINNYGLSIKKIINHKNNKIDINDLNEII